MPPPPPPMACPCLRACIEAHEHTGEHSGVRPELCTCCRTAVRILEYTGVCMHICGAVHMHVCRMHAVSLHQDWGANCNGALSNLGIVNRDTLDWSLAMACGGQGHLAARQLLFWLCRLPAGSTDANDGIPHPDVAEVCGCRRPAGTSNTQSIRYPHHKHVHITPVFVVD
jgi:hypothetical protein